LVRSALTFQTTVQCERSVNFFLNSFMDSDLLHRLQDAEARCSALLKENAQIKNDMVGLARSLSLSLAADPKANDVDASPNEPMSIIPELPSSLQRARSHASIGEGVKEAVTLCAGDLVWMQEHGSFQNNLSQPFARIRF
jgi:hypothetical protein